MNIYLVYFTEAGRSTCRKIEETLTGDGHCCAASDGRQLPGGLARWTQEAFALGEALVFVSATGIAVRAIAPHLKSKTTDPAVVVVDERGLHAISLLSGHMGGANRLTRRLAEAVGARPVITTATDINGIFAVDQWAKEQDLIIADMKAAKAVSAALLRGETVFFYSELSVEGSLPDGLRPWEPGGEAREKSDVSAVVAERKAAGIGIVASLKRPENAPFEEVLWLAPRSLILGIGCRRGATEEQIANAARQALDEAGLEIRTVRKIVSIDLKEDEAGLIAFARGLGVPFEVFTADELMEADVPRGGFTPSEFVRSVTGVDNVCERAAILGVRGEGAEEEGGTRSDALGPNLVLRKRAGGGVTVAAAIRGDLLLRMPRRDERLHNA